MRIVKQKHLAIFTPTLDGGVGKVLANLSKGFSDLGTIKIDVLTLTDSGEFRSSIQPYAQIIPFHVNRTFRAFIPLIKYLKKEKPDTLLSVSFHANIVAILAKKIAFSPVHLVVSEHIAIQESLKTLPVFKKVILKKLIQILYPMAYARIAVSIAASQQLKTLLKHNVSVETIPNIVVTNDLYEKSLETPDHEWFLYPSTTPIIVSVGRLTTQKDYPTLIHAISLVKNEMPIRLIILGEGEERQYLTEMIHKQNLANEIALIGFKKNPYPYIKKASLFVLSSGWEGLPTVLIEALALSTKIVSTDCPSGPDEILHHGLYGELVPPHNPRKLADAIIKKLKSDSSSTTPSQILDMYRSDYVINAYKRLLFPEML